MKHHRILAMTLLLSFATHALVASAQEPTTSPPRGGERFKAADKDGNGQLSKEEVAASMPRVGERFDALDTNKDGQLSPSELRAGRTRRQNGS